MLQPLSLSLTEDLAQVTPEILIKIGTEILCKTKVNVTFRFVPINNLKEQYVEYMLCNFDFNV